LPPHLTPNFLWLGADRDSQNKGIFQLKIARTGKFVKDKIESKFLSGAAVVGAKDRRSRGADIEVEQEGTSRI
jgi:hypothetical protein